MLFLGLQGSPRLKGNTHFLLSLFLEEAEKQGARSLIIHVDKKDIQPCKEYIVCEKKGFCPIKDDMKHEIYALLRKADVVVAASPIFFYNFTAQLKALIDRSQTLWARKYKLKLKDPGYKTRKGFLLSVGATRGKNLFEGLKLTAAYFFDAIDAKFEGSLTYRDIEAAGDLRDHPTVRQDVQTAVTELMKPWLNRKKILFLCRENAVLSQMAAAYTQYFFGDIYETASAGITPSEQIDKTMETVMAEKGIDMAFRIPQPFVQAVEGSRPDRTIFLGPAEMPPGISTATAEHWTLPDPSGKSVDFVRELRDVIEKHVKERIPFSNEDHQH
jgi:arsenite transporter/arsenate reductase (thioredoxin)